MTNKTIIAGLVALAFVAGTMMTGTMVYAEHKPGHQTNSGGLGDLQRQVDENTGHVTVLKGQADSFFDIFYERFASPDSFFDIFVDASGERVDSFFDIFTEISVHDADVEEIQTELVALELRGTDPTTGNAPDSFFDVFTEISVHNADVERIDTEMLSLDLRLNDQQEQIDGLISNPPSETASAASFVKFDGVDGEATDDSHQNWSDLLSFNQGQHQPDEAGTGETRRRGDVIMDDIVVVKELDKASPKIAEAVTLGKVFPKVDIEVTRSYGDSGRLTYYAYELTNVIVSSYNISGSGQAEDVPVEQFSLNFEEIKVTYTERDSDGNKKGNVEYSWKVEEGES